MASSTGCLGVVIEAMLTAHGVAAGTADHPGSSRTSWPTSSSSGASSCAALLPFGQPAASSTSIESTDVNFNLEHVGAHLQVDEAHQRSAAVLADCSEPGVCAVDPAPQKAPPPAPVRVTSIRAELEDRALRVILAEDECPRASGLPRAVDRCTNDFLILLRAVVNALWLARRTPRSLLH